MGKNQTETADELAVENSNQLWVNFLKGCKICAVVICITLILMAIFLV